MRVFLLAGLLSVFLFPGRAFSQDSPDAVVKAGTVDFVEGNVLFYDKQRRSRSPKAGDAINEGDSIVTGADGEVQLRLEDTGFIAVRPNTKMRIANFRAEGDEDDRLNIGLLEGSFRSMTGWIARFSRGNYVIRTPTATIGVRGTDHEPYHVPDGSPLGEPGTYDKVNEGGTFLQSKFGRVEVAPGKSGFANLRGTAPPRALERPPAFFKPTRNEARFANRHAEIQRDLQQRHEERRREVEQRRLQQKGQPPKPAAARPDLRQKFEAQKAERQDKLEQRRKAIEEQRKAAEARRKAAEERRKNLKKEHVKQSRVAHKEALKQRHE